MSVDPDAIRQVLRQVTDPEVGLSVTDLGLVYDILVDEADIHVQMTLTSPSCQAGGQILSDVDRVIRSLDGVTSVEVELVWEPWWTPERIDPKVRAFMGY